MFPYWARVVWLHQRPACCEKLPSALKKKARRFVRGTIKKKKDKPVNASLSYRQLFDDFIVGA